MKFKNLKIKDKLAINNLFPVIIFLIALMFWFFNFIKIKNTAFEIKDNLIPDITSIIQIQDSFNKSNIMLERFIITGDKAKKEEFKQELSNFERNLSNYNSTNKIEKQFMNRLLHNIAFIKEKTDIISENSIINPDLKEDIRKNSDEIAAFLTYFMNQKKSDTSNKINNGVKLVTSTIILFLSIFILLIPLNIFISRYISKPIFLSIKKLTDSTRIIAKGNFSYKITKDSEDEIGYLCDAFNNMAEELAILKKHTIENILSSIPASVLVFDIKSYTVKYINDFFLQSYPVISKKSIKSQILGKKIDSIIPDIYMRKIEKFSKKYLNGNNTEKFESRIESRMYDNILFPISTEEESEKLIGLVINEITETKLFQNYVSNNEKLIYLGKATSGIAHEINNPLYVILSKAEQIADDEKNNSKSREDGQEIIDLVVYISNIIKDISSYSKILRSDTYMDVDLNQTINDAIKIVRYSYNFLEIDVVNELSEIPKIKIAKGEMLQVFINLINNAIQAMEGKGILKIKSKYENSAIKISISDTGRGITEKDKMFIFDLFFTTKNPDEGIGQGLNIVKKIIEKNNAIIEFESEVEKGTTFYLTFFTDSQTKLPIS